MSSAAVSGSRTPLLPDIHNPDKQRKTPTSKSFPEWIKENPVHPAAEKTQIPTEHEIAQFRKPLRHSVCVELLREGFHRSYEQMFALLQRWDGAEEHPHKLHTLQQHLTRAESAERDGQYGEAYDSHMLLARFFTEPEDEWLKHHFLQLALDSARKFKMDSGKREAEANLYMGQVYLQKGQLERAREHYEVFYHLTLGRTWQDPSGRMQHSRSCEELQKVFTLLGQRLLQEQDHAYAIKMFTKAYEMAKESGDGGSEREAAYRLGLAYQSTGNQKTAKQFFSVCMEISTTLENADSLGRAYEAIAKSLESEGKLTEATEYLEKFVEISLNSRQDRNLEKAYMCLGNILSLRKQYDGAHEHFGRAYEIACNLASLVRLQKAQVCAGSARALSMMQAYHRLIETPGRQEIKRIISWKERRNNSAPLEEEMKR
ncbi:tetratricopeptide repeat protein 29 isoform X1 [Labeo rohita]|uniref:tetratricopeptide repeat protein 29 isoform X1 n=1 Tax=Labeo rohita TaxID=84645 RepID=UPI0021E33F74|nr:tetratricopeptide repeat protein 29 isoform X1 [Labeo rohita]XP_050987162.1 tetratricopeptide repeat protein 29 isoform X1 [Labeo rohita]XP_050987163.1 tetratricopeptide repeat protein 29 isoform X1 [Labeo rohita]